MKERPIIFNAEMVRALLDGRKTQTRRTVNIQPKQQLDGFWLWADKKLDAGYCYTRMEPMVSFMKLCCPFGQPGDRLWVREKMRVIELQGTINKGISAIRVKYESDGRKSGWIPWPDRLKEVPVLGKCLSNGGHREASRILLEITYVRVERVQDISDGDCWDEGVESFLENDDNLPTYADGTPAKYNNIKEAYAALWKSIYGESWDRNDWVWVIEFRRIK